MKRELMDLVLARFFSLDFLLEHGDKDLLKMIPQLRSMSSNAKLSLVAAIKDERLLREYPAGWHPSHSPNDAFEIRSKNSGTWERFVSQPLARKYFFDDAMRAKFPGHSLDSGLKYTFKSRGSPMWFANAFDVRTVPVTPVERNGLFFRCNMGGRRGDECPFGEQEPEAFEPLIDGQRFRVNSLQRRRAASSTRSVGAQRCRQSSRSRRRRRLDAIPRRGGESARSRKREGDRESPRLVRAAAIFATFSSRAGQSAIYAYNQAVATIKGADLNNLTSNQLQAKQHLETNRTNLCACCRYKLNVQNRKADGYDELRDCLKRMKDECIGKKCPICLKKFVKGDQPIIEFDHRDRDTKEFEVTALTRIARLGLGVPAMKLERAKCDGVHYHCHRQRSFLQRWGLDDHAIPFSDETLELIAARRKPHRTFIMRKKLAIGECACGCGRKVTEGNYMCFDFAHKHGVDKVKNVAHCYYQDEIEAEIAKCRLLFCECHKKQETDRDRPTWKNKIAAAAGL